MKFFRKKSVPFSGREVLKVRFSSSFSSFYSCRHLPLRPALTTLPWLERVKSEVSQLPLLFPLPLLRLQTSCPVDELVSLALAAGDRFSHAEMSTANKKLCVCQSAASCEVSSVLEVSRFLYV